MAHKKLYKMKRKRILLIVALLAVVIGVLALTNFGKIMDWAMKNVDIERKDFKTEQAAFTISADALSAEFKTNMTAANEKYINKAVLLNGKITDIQSPIISIGNIACTMDSTQLEKLSTLKVGDEVKVQGQFVGYNELLEELDFSQCGLK